MPTWGNRGGGKTIRKPPQVPSCLVMPPLPSHRGPSSWIKVVPANPARKGAPAGEAGPPTRAPFLPTLLPGCRPPPMPATSRHPSRGRGRSQLCRGSTCKSKSRALEKSRPSRGRRQRGPARPVGRDPRSAGSRPYPMVPAGGCTEVALEPRCPEASRPRRRSPSAVEPGPARPAGGRPLGGGGGAALSAAPTSWAPPAPVAACAARRSAGAS